VPDVRRVVASVALVLVLTAASHERGGGSPTTTQTTEVPTAVPAPNMLPLPNQGTPPHDVGDRGGAAQIALAVTMFGAVGLIGVKVVRDSRRARSGGP
jgi:hypothetical protein